MSVRRLLCGPLAAVVCLTVSAVGLRQESSPSSQQTATATTPADPAQLPSARNKEEDQEKETVIQGPQRRLPNRRPITTSSVEGLVTSADGRGIGGTRVIIRDSNGHLHAALTDADGVFRIGDLKAGVYQIELRRQGFQDFTRQNVRVSPGEVLSIEVKLQTTEEYLANGPMDRPLAGAVPPKAGQTEAEAKQPYNEMRRRPTRCGS